MIPSDKQMFYRGDGQKSASFKNLIIVKLIFLIKN